MSFNICINSKTDHVLLFLFPVSISEWWYNSDNATWKAKAISIEKQIRKQNNHSGCQSEQNGNDGMTSGQKETTE